MADDVDIANHKAEQVFALRINAARIRSLTTGRESCAVCGEVIGLDRRKANPVAIRCIDCQEDFEEGASL